MSFKHEVEVEIDCDECGSGIDDTDEVVCRECFDHVNEELGKVREELKTLEDEDSENQERIGTLEGEVEDKQDRIEQLEARVAELEEKLKTAKSIDDILGVLDHYDMKDKASQMPESISDDGSIAVGEVGR